MRHRVAYRKLGRVTDHRIAMLRNQATALLRYEHLTTTVPRAKELRPFVERLITIAKRGFAAAARKTTTRGVAAERKPPSPRRARHGEPPLRARLVAANSRKSQVTNKPASPKRDSAKAGRKSKAPRRKTPGLFLCSLYFA